MIPSKQLEVKLGHGLHRRMLSEAMWRPNEKNSQVFGSLSLEIGSGSFGHILKVGAREQ